ncbi:uncharacterized protein DEA37_0002163 [Paragonimus westermani]|uniref:Uncharacterized protein n=1 Tax=Paragonimus westermani TaxID=34504 RepID=A0A5J4P0U5_9TREM|nr:uncharacterized protein DEA37_0002163 [Paragonimus westermani]
MGNLTINLIGLPCLNKSPENERIQFENDELVNLATSWFGKVFQRFRGMLLGCVWMNNVQSQVMDEMDESNMPYASWTYSKRWSPVKEFHQLEPIEVRRRAVPLKRWSPVKEFHYPEPFEVKKRPLLLKRWSPVKEFHYPEPVEVKKR